MSAPEGSGWAVLAIAPRGSTMIVSVHATEREADAAAAEKQAAHPGYGMQFCAVADAPEGLS